MADAVKFRSTFSTRLLEIRVVWATKAMIFTTEIGNTLITIHMSVFDPRMTGKRSKTRLLAGQNKFPNCRCFCFYWNQIERYTWQF